MRYSDFYIIFVPSKTNSAMIQELKIKNFLSFKDEVKFSFEASNDKFAENSQVVKINENARLLRFAIIYGYNASGKSNLLSALSFLSYFWTFQPKNLDAKTSSGVYHKTEKKFYTRSYGMFATWWRMIYTSRDKQWLSALLFGLKAWWQLNLHVLLGIVKLNVKIPLNYMKGLKDAWAFVHSDEFKAIPPYVISDLSRKENDHGSTR